VLDVRMKHKQQFKTFLKKLGTPPPKRQNALQLALPNPPFHQIKYLSDNAENPGNL